MNSHAQRELDLRLRAAARPAATGRVHQASAQALLERIVTTPRSTEAPTPQPAPRRRTVRHPARWAVTGAAAAAAITVAALVVPGLGGQTQAYASWTVTPAALPADTTATLSRDCLQLKLTPGWGYTQAELDGARKVLGERRGAYDYVAMATRTWTATCFRDKAGTVHWGSVFEAPVSDAKLGHNGIELQAWGQLKTAEGYARLMAGHLGSDIVGVDITTPDGKTVQATTRDGYFLAWYPETVDEARPTTVDLRLKGGGTIEGLRARDLYDAPKLD